MVLFCLKDSTLIIAILFAYCAVLFCLRQSTVLKQSYFVSYGLVLFCLKVSNRIVAVLFS